MPEAEYIYFYRIEVFDEKTQTYYNFSGIVGLTEKIKSPENYNKTIREILDENKVVMGSSFKVLNFNQV